MKAPEGFWKVRIDDEGIRPAGPPDACFYCAQKVGELHTGGCVIRERTVVIRYTVEIVVREPEDWDSGRVEFAHNESSRCQSNLAAELVALNAMPDKCLCHAGKVEFVREATADDEETYGVFVAEGRLKK